MKCGYCHHEEKDRCKGGQSHLARVDKQRMTPLAYCRFTVCSSRHCESALCDCLAFTTQPTLRQPLRREVSDAHV